MAKKESPYFKDFISMIEISCNAAKHLQTSLKEFSPARIQKRRLAIREIKYEADRIKQEIVKRLIKEFIPPIDRGDIISLAHCLDDITDKIEDVYIYVYMFNIRKIRPDVLLMTEVIIRCCQVLGEAVVVFPGFTKSKVLGQKITEVNAIKEEGDQILIEAVRKLYTSSNDPVELYVWTKLFELLKECCAACKKTADELELIVLKNS